MTNTLELTKDWDLRTCTSVIDDAALVELSSDVRNRLDQGFSLFERRSFNESVYGVNTGLGPIVTTDVPRERLIEQQYQLVLSHASGIGPAISYRHARATTLARLRSLSQGYSAVRSELAEVLCSFLNSGVAPIIPRHGGVGASGDLVQLAHLALGLIGHGELQTAEEKMPAPEAFKRRLGQRPYELEFRDGLALCNGTSCMTGIAICNIVDARRLLQHAMGVAARLAAITGISAEPFSSELNGVKRHRSQSKVAEQIRLHLSRLSVAGNGGTHRPLQEHYSIRCTPQILAPISGTLDHAEQTVMDEFNSVSDNPVFDPDSNQITHGGNFHGEPIAQAMDQLRISVVKLTMLFERQLNFLLNDDVNKFLPPFLNEGTVGVNFGLQGAQFTAVSTTAHSQALATPMSVHSIPSNKDNQDIVSMGCDSALMTSETIENCQTVLTVLVAAVAKAMKITGVASTTPDELSKVIDRWQHNSRADDLGASLSEQLVSLKEIL